MQRGEKLPFLQAAVRIVEKICLRLIQPFQCSGLKTIFEVPPEDAYRNVILDLQTSEVANPTGCCSRTSGTRAISSPKGEMAFHRDKHIRRHLPTLIWPLIALTSRAG